MSEIKNVVEICDEAFTSRVSEREEYNSMLTKWNAAALTFCARDIFNVRGYVVLYANDINSRRAFVSMLGVRPKFQRQGCGKFLLAACEEIARENSMKKISLEVNKKNINGINFYRHSGFKEDEEREQSYIYSKNIFTIP